MDHSRNIMIVCSLGLLALLMLVPVTTWAADNGEADFAKGWDLLKHKKYKEARAALETGMKKNQSNALAHYYLADACRGLKDWPCAEEHYETSLELDAKSSVAELAKQRGRKAKVWRLLDEAKATIAESKTSPGKVQSAEDQLAIADRLGLDDEQQAVYEELRDKAHGSSKAPGLNKESAPSVSDTVNFIKDAVEKKAYLSDLDWNSKNDRWERSSPPRMMEIREFTYGEHGHTVDFLYRGRPHDESHKKVSFVLGRVIN